MLSTFLLFLLMKFDYKKLNGLWYQCATNDPTIPLFCKEHNLLFSLSEDETNYKISFTADCICKDFTVPIHGDIKNDKFYDNFEFLPKVNENKIINVVENDETYEIVEWLALYNTLKIYQLWSRKKLDQTTIQKYIENSKEQYNFKFVRVDYGNVLHR